jgi:rod shape-determining protein MreD
MRHLMSAVVVAVAVVLQLAAADRIVFPGGTGPDLVLLTVAALALATGPMAGSVIGFCAGLALDVAPPAGHLVGQDALVFCLIGYACGLVADGPATDGIAEQEHSALFELTVTAAGTVCGEAMIAALGVMLSDPRVTWAAIKHVLPVAVGYDLLLSPFVLLTVAAMLRLAGSREAAPGLAMSAATQRRAAWAANPATAGAVRQLAGSGSPRLHLSSQGRGGGSGQGSRSGPGRQPLGGGGLGPGRREPRLKLGRAGTSTGRPAARRPSPSGAKLKFGTRRGEGSLLGRPGSSVFGGGGATAARLASSRLGSTLLGGSVFSGSRSAFGRGGRGGLAGIGGRGGLGGLGAGMRAPSPVRIKIRRSRRRPGNAHPGSGPHAPRFRKSPAVSRLARGLSRPGQRKSPGKGWLRGSAISPSRRSLSGSALSGRSLSGRSLSGGSAVRGIFHRKRTIRSGSLGLGGSGLGGSGLGGSGLGGSGLGGGRPRLRMGRQKSMKMKKRRNWRRSGGFR